MVFAYSTVEQQPASLHTGLLERGEGEVDTTMSAVRVVWYFIDADHGHLEAVGCNPGYQRRRFGVNTNNYVTRYLFTL